MRVSAVQFELNDYFIRMGAIGISRGDIGCMPNSQLRTKEGFYYYCSDKSNYLLFNERNGLIVQSYSYFDKKGPDGVNIPKSSVCFIGPNGVSKTASASLGRFEEPIAERTFDMRRLWIYEGKQRRFYLINFDDAKLPPDPNLQVGINGSRLRWEKGVVSRDRAGCLPQQEMLTADGRPNTHFCRIPLSRMKNG